MEVLNLGTLKHILFNTLIGELALVWDDSNNLVKQVILPSLVTGKSVSSKINYHGVILESNPSKEIRRLISNIKRSILGDRIVFDIDMLDLSELSQFQREVLKVQFNVPYGYATSYKSIAQKLGKPRNARPVSNVLSSNPLPIIIPCHRTVKSDWLLGGYGGSQDSHYKELLLKKEGVKIKNDVVLPEYRCVNF